MGKNRVSYGGRAFRQDANHAMKGDIVRGLIELITNADDAYGDSPTGKIRIEVEHRRNKPWRVVVRDRAKGMRKARMREAIGGLGERTSGFEIGADVRGNLGRGAKDLAAFGPVAFESICEGYHTKMVLEADGSYDDPFETKVTEEHRETLGIPRGNGTTVTVEAADNFKCPQHATLLDRLSNHYQLRDINSDPRRELALVDLNSMSTDTVRYGRPTLPEVLTTELEITGYPEASATLAVYRNDERYENGPTDSGRPEGILVKGRRAVYENSLFSFEANPYAHWFSGTLSCPYIDTLALDYDQRFSGRLAQDPENPIPIITRSRDGLEHDHPFFKALAAAVDLTLEPLVRQEEQEAKQGEVRESEHLRRTLDALGRDLGKMLDSDLKEIDEDGLTGGADGHDVEPLRLVPENPVLYFGENKTVSVVALRSVGATEVSIEPDPEGVVELLDGPVVPLADHPRREDYLIASIRLRPLIEDEETYLTIRCGDHEVVALVEVRPEREEPEPSPPEDFEFQRERYQMTVGKKRQLTVQAPVDVVNECGTHCGAVSSSPDVVIMRGACELEFDEDLLCFVGQLEVDPRVLGAKATLTATLGDRKTSCEVVVVQHDRGGPNLKIEIRDEASGRFRAIVEKTPTQVVIKIQGGHPAIKRYLGPGPEFPRQDELTARTVIAEIIAGEATRMVMEKKFSAPGELEANGFYHEHLSYMQKYLTRCHKMMIGDAELK